jgi:glycyl-tRNA synthetase beta chain
VVLSLAEKVDNLMGSYSVGNIPKGSADPYALRRQANAIVEMLISSSVALDMKKLMTACAVKYRMQDGLLEKILEFISARANTIFSERGFRYDEIDACLSINYFDYLELYRRAKALNEFRKTRGFSEMLLGFKRMNNIVSAFRQKNTGYALALKQSLLAEESERKLFEFFNSRRDRIDRLIASNEYISLFGLLIEGKAIIDEFFDSVMVMAEDTAVRDNRLALLESILGLFKNLMDFSKIAE